MTAHKSLQRMFDSSPIFTAAKTTVASNVAKLRRWVAGELYVMKVFCIILAVAIMPITAHAESHVVDGVRISLPVGWIRVPQKQIELMEALMRKKYPTSQQHWDFIFQARHTDKWVNYPYVGVEIVNNGRISESSLRNIKNQSITESEFSKVEKDLSPLVSSIQLGRRYYDAKRHIVWMMVSENVQNTTHVTVTTGLVLTSTGYIKVYCALRTQNIDRMARVCRSIVGSVRAPRGHAY